MWLSGLQSQCNVNVHVLESLRRLQFGQFGRGSDKQCSSPVHRSEPESDLRTLLIESLGYDSTPFRASKPGEKLKQFANVLLNDLQMTYQNLVALSTLEQKQALASLRILRPQARSNSSRR